VSKARQKGTSAETAVVTYLRDNGFPHTERRALHGAADKGDLTGIPGIAVEIKNCRRYEIPRWLAETTTEGIAANAEHAVLVVKPNGVGTTRVGEWWAILPLASMSRLLRAAGHGIPLEDDAA
jgi:hypothetical protein